ncbi:hypothetical protein F2Q70_00032687 [Brassica cretica]|uniref:Uncharacterized protein n=1 Tax=Brassica cretica TaxID=69181 RepID=A0A8S9FGG5_BRACR|nr:hypothetical protein F2Q70_00032687 [Brassica cretica]
MSLFSLHRSIPLPFNTKSESQYHHLSFSITFLYSSSLCSSGICTPPENASLSPLQSNLNPILASLSISSHVCSSVSVVFSLLLAARVGFDRGVSVSDPAVPDADSVSLRDGGVSDICGFHASLLLFVFSGGLRRKRVVSSRVGRRPSLMVLSCGGAWWFHGVALLVTGSVLSSPPDGCASFEGHFSRGGVPDLSHCGGGLKGCIRSRVWGMEAAIFGLVLNDDIAGCRLFLDFLEAVGPGTLRYEGAFLSGSRQLGARSAHVFA